MQTRFIAFISGTPTAAAKAADIARARVGFAVGYSSKTLTVLVNLLTDIIPISNNIGAVIGTAFSRAPLVRRITSIDGALSAACRKRGPAALLKEVWGGYIACLAPEGEKVRILRDPSGALPCYCLQQGDVTVLASDTELIVQSLRWSPDIDWPTLASYLHTSFLRTEQTCLQGIKEVLVGNELTVLDRSVTQISQWTPWDYVTFRKELSDRDRQAHLRETIRDCVKAWANQYEKIALSISGGLDSSIVAACAAHSNAHLTAFTRVTDDPIGDERKYARLVAEAIHTPLLECFYDPKAIDLSVSVAAHLPRPFGLQNLHPLNSFIRRLANEHGVQAHFSGNGGDNVFCYMQSATPIVDRLCVQGPNAEAFLTFMDVCKETDSTIWKIGRETRKAIASARRPYVWKASSDFLLRDHQSFIADHPWLHRRTGTPYGKAVHVALLLQSLSSIEGARRDIDVPTISPLLSQPVSEAALSIPSWEWVANGQNRSAVRSAFQNALPDVILRRLTKGGPDGFLIELFERHRKWLRDWFGDGLLRRNGIVDISAIDRALTAPTSLTGTTHFLILQLADVEAWARHWYGLRGPSFI